MAVFSQFLSAAAPTSRGIFSSIRLDSTGTFRHDPCPINTLRFANQSLGMYVTALSLDQLEPRFVTLLPVNDLQLALLDRVHLGSPVVNNRKREWTWTTGA